MVLLDNNFISLGELTQKVKSAFVRSNVNDLNAQIVADALVKAEIDGKFGHGVSRVMSYAAQSKIGKVDGNAEPLVSQNKPSVLSVDASNGFAYPAIKMLTDLLPKIAHSQGIAMGGVYRSHHFGVAGHIVEKIADMGMVSLLFGNTPSAIAPWKGNKALFGTNPLAFGAPTENGEHLIIDLAVSKVARGKILKATQENKKIPLGWAVDKYGIDTDDPKEALKGTMLPFGDAKGSALALMIEILAAAITGSNFAYEADSFLDTNGKPPNVGQLLIIIDPESMGSKKRFFNKIGSMMESILAQEGTHLPGSNRFELRKKAVKEGLYIDQKILGEIEKIT